MHNSATDTRLDNDNQIEANRLPSPASDCRLDDYGKMKDLLERQIDLLHYFSQEVSRDLLTIRIPYSMPLPSAPRAEVLGSYHLNCAQSLINAMSHSGKHWTTIKQLANSIHTSSSSPDGSHTVESHVIKNQIHDQLVEVYKSYNTFVGVIDTLQVDETVCRASQAP
ncbi:hypothetical protein BBP40_001576 [Aspergillus hancockii]|nr:hypothetical protein BBP40_001576 [Aspergillus hancockii]